MLNPGSGQPEQGNGSAGYLMTRADQLIGNVELFGNAERVNGFTSDDAGSYALNLVPDSRESLCHGVVDFMRQPFPFAIDGVGLPVRETEVGKLDQQRRTQRANEKHSNVPWRPPRRAVDDDRMLHKGRMAFKFGKLMPGGRVHAGIAPLGV